MKVVKLTVCEDRFDGMSDAEAVELVKQMIAGGVYLDEDHIADLKIEVHDCGDNCHLKRAA